MVPTFSGTDQVHEELGSARAGDAALWITGERGGDPNNESSSPVKSLCMKEVLRKGRSQKSSIVDGGAAAGRCSHGHVVL